MARNLVLILFLSMAMQSAQADSILGSWEFYKLFYHNQEIPPLNPHLRLYFEFINENTDRLFYFHDDETGSCEREATYQYNDAEQSLIQKVTWVNPNNSSQCGKDPDMLMGTESTSHLEIKNSEMYLLVPLGEETITYIWKRGQRPTSAP